MRTRTLTHSILTALAIAWLLPIETPARAATPAVCQGRFAVDGAPLDLGAGLDPIATLAVAARVSLNGGSPGFAVRLDDACFSLAATVAPRTDAFTIRSRFGACGAIPRFRMRLLFDADCGRVTGRIRSAGRVVAEFTARPDLPAGGTTTTTLPAPPPIPVTEPTPPVDQDQPADPTGTPIGTTAKLTVVSPLGARVGDTISVFGTNLDRDRNGVSWTGTAPYVVQFRRANIAFGTVRADFTFVSATELRVVVPPAAASDTIALAERRANGTTGTVFSRSLDRFVVVAADTTPPPAPVQAAPPASANRGTLVVQGSDQNALSPGTFTLSGAQNQVGAFMDGNRNAFIDLGAGRTDVPFPAFPVRTSSVDLTITQGRGYFAGADAILWVFFEGGNPAVFDNRDVFVAIHLDIDVAAHTARPIAMLAGVAGSPGIVVSTDQFTEASFTVEPPVVGGPGALRAHVAAVPNFLELIFVPSAPIAPGVPDLGPSFFERLWANGIVLDVDVPLFNDAA